MYILLIVFAIGNTFSTSDFKITQIELNNKNACLKLANNMVRPSKGIKFICVGKDNGDYIVVD